MQAKIEKKKKDAAYASAKLKYWNRETSYVRGTHRIGMGLSRSQSDAYTKALYTLGKGREYGQALYKAYQTKQAVDEGGRSRRFGHNQKLALLDRQAQIEKTIDSTFGRNWDIVQEGIKRQYQNQWAKNRQALGVRPEYGAPVFMPPKDRAGQMWANLQMGLSIASLAVSGGIGVQQGKPGAGIFSYPA